MIRALWEWLWPPHCDHEWERLSHTTVYPGQSKDALPSSHVWLFRCKKCGRSKKYSI